MDEAAFHISAHGRLSCTECHDGKEKGHPYAKNVDKAISDFFQRERCLQCHESVEKDLDRAFHGGRHVETGASYDNCLACHDPHAQLSLSAVREGKADPRISPWSQCSSCHQGRDRLPSASKEQQGCLKCHSLDIARKEGPEFLCFHCHEKDSPGAKQAGTPLIAAVQYAKTPHADVSCLACHPGAAGYGHSSQGMGDCTVCHSPHHEKTTGDAHITVSCQACHLPSIKPEKNRPSGMILWKRPSSAGQASDVHHMIKASGDDACKRCHFRGNEIGAAAWVLPAKGVLCMPCHTSTLSASDTFTILGLVLFLGGLALSFSYVFSSLGKAGHNRKVEKQEASDSGKRGCCRALSAGVLLDTLLQRRLFRHSPGRWLIHGLVFYGFALRFLWGITALAASLADPPWIGLRFMLDKNDVATGIFFDVTGLMVLAGICLMGLRAFRVKVLPDLPRSDFKALGLLAALVLVGFAAEGIRIAMAGFPEGSRYSFVGSFVGGLLSGTSDLEEIYGYLWYLHAALTAAFIAYIPFSRLFHIIISPVTLAIAALKRH
jgi:nitrate reductase gamma subunit